MTHTSNRLIASKKGVLRDVSCNTFEYLGGVPRALVPDNLNSAVTKVDNHGPVVDRMLLDMENHYGTVILPTRSAKPRDKAILERVVRVVYSRIFAPLRNMTFHSLEQLKQEMV